MTSDEFEKALAKMTIGWSRMATALTKLAAFGVYYFPTVDPEARQFVHDTVREGLTDIIAVQFETKSEEKDDTVAAIAGREGEGEAIRN